MPNYRRSWVKGGTFFFTVVTYHRQPILTSDTARRLLRSAWKEVQQRFPFTIDAVCLLPEHIHCIWVLPEEDADYSVRWKEIKRLFTQRYLEQIGIGEARSASRLRRGEAAIWQRRFWEHTIRDEADLNRHRETIHYNPVKHGQVDRVSAWRWSSFHRYVRMGFYDLAWVQGVEADMKTMRCGE